MVRSLVFVFLAVICVGFVFSTIVGPCSTNGTSVLNSIDIDGCDDGLNDFCRFIKGNTYKIKVNLSAESIATELSYSGLTGFVALGVPIKMFGGNVCNISSVGDCPTAFGETIVFEHNLEILTTFPALRTPLRLEVQDENKKLMVCARMNIGILNPSTPTI